MEKVTNKEVLSRLDMKATMLLQKAKTLKLKYVSESVISGLNNPFGLTPSLSCKQKLELLLSQQ